MNPEDIEPSGQDGRAMEVFSKDARVTARMLTQDQPITKAQRAAIIRDPTS